MPDPVIDEIKRRIDLTELVSGRVALKKAGRTIKGLCPFHEEKTPSFVVYPDQGTYHCFGCGKRGDIFTWLQETEQLDFGAALRQLAQRAGVTLPQRQEASEAAQRRERLVAAVGAAAAFYHRELLAAQTADAKAARAYVAQRGISDEVVERFALGYAPDGWERLFRHLKQQGVTAETAVEAGLVREREGGRGHYDLFRQRLLFPIRDPSDGRTVLGFGGRSLDDDVQPKYLNSPQTPLFDKSTVLYGLDQARQTIRRDDQAVIVEGYMDALAAHQHGFTNVVAALGTALTERQVAQVRRHTTRLVLALDADAAGQAATLRGLDVVHDALTSQPRPVPDARGLIRYEAVLEGEIKIAALPAGRDPDEVIRESPQAWEQLIATAKPVVEFAIDAAVRDGDLGSARGKSEVAAGLFPLIQAVPERIARSHYLTLLAGRLGVDEGALAADMARGQRKSGQQRQASRRRPVSAPSGGPERAADDLGEAPPPTAAVVEEHFLTVLLTAPNVLARLPYRPELADFQRPECREVYRAVLAAIEVRAEGDDASALLTLTTTALREALDESLWAHYDWLVGRNATLPPTTRSQQEAALREMALRLIERTKREAAQQTTAQLSAAEQQGQENPEAASATEGDALKAHGAKTANDLFRVQLARERLPPYSGASS